jgi:alpha-beta hydrolase superfamily lysophospholipase
MQKLRNFSIVLTEVYHDFKRANNEGIPSGGGLAPAGAVFDLPVFVELEACHSQLIELKDSPMNIADSPDPLSIKREEGYFVGKWKTRIYTQSWLPAGSPRGAVVLVHGLFEHSGRYRNLVNCLVPRGFAIFACDHRGHGKSEGLRGYVDRFGDYVEDLSTLVDVEIGRYAGKPVFIFGNSMGGTIATAYVAGHQEAFAGMVVTGPLIMPGTSTTSLSTMSARVLSAVVPKMGISRIESAGISRDPKVVDAYLKDPLVYTGKIRARLGAELLDTMEKVLPSKMRAIRLPILVAHGSADSLCNVQGSVHLHGSVKSRDKTLKLYDGFYHEILNEPGSEHVLADIRDWIEAHLTGGGF